MPPADRRRRPPLNPAMIAVMAVAAVLLILAIVSYTRGRDNQDRLGDEQAEDSRSADPEARCASQRTYDLIKRELFRRAAQVRGSDQAAFDRLAAYSALRVEAPVLRSVNEDLGTATCSAAVALDLPPGVAVVGRRRTLSADVDYAVQPAADGSGDVITLSNAEAIVTPLATLVRVDQPAPSPAPNEGEIPSVLNDEGSVPPLSAPAAPAIEPGPTEPAAPTASARPSFNCSNARTRGEIAVCNDSGLASLDRQMASQFNTAIARADAEERALLVRTRTRFLRFRDGCRSDDCIADAYRGRMREIGDIMAGRWSPR